MLSVILIWLYMLFTCYVTGFAFIRVISGKKTFQFGKRTSYLYAGIGTVTVYAQLFSIFYKVGLMANGILLLICLLCILAFRKEILEDLHTFRLTVQPARIVISVVLLLLFAYGTSTGIIHYDTSLYHAQSIRWIEEYGAILGLGNLHSRLAYNSAAFCLSALYSMSFLGGQSYHCCAGFLAYLLALVCSEMFSKKRERKPLLSDFARIVSIYYLLMVFDEMVSPASDYFMVFLVFYIVIRWLELIENKENSYFPYALLSLLCLVVLTVKLSGAFILLLALKPAAMMMKEKRGKDIGKFLGLGFLTVIPFLIRNVMLSGWLIYPFTSIDFFSFDFKIPKGMAEYDAKEIQVWGRGFNDVSRYDDSLMKWLPEWVENLDASNKVFLVFAVIGVALFILTAIYGIIKKKRDMTDFLHIAGTITICFLFWLLSAPLIRYGCVFLWLSPVLVWGNAYLKISPHLDRFKIYLILLLFFGVYKFGVFGIEVYKNATLEYLICQKDYENFETESYLLHGYTFYYPKEGDRVGYQDFPASPVKAEDIFRGETIEEGFKDVIHQ